MKYHLTVVHEFGNYNKGQRITDPAEVDIVLAGHNHTHVVKTAAPDEPEVPSVEPVPPEELRRGD